MAQETLEQTQRRLGLATTVDGSTARRQRTPSPLPAAPRKKAGGAGVIGFLVVAGIVAGGAVLAFTAVDGADGVNWEEYPGTSMTSEDEVLSAPTLEENAAEGDELLEQLKVELAAYGFEWTVLYPSSVAAVDNTYGGTSMLQNYDSDTVLGSAAVTSPGARAEIAAIFARVMGQDPENEIVLSNDQFDPEDSIYYFGSDDRDRQAMWSMWTYQYSFNSIEVDLDIFDATVPTDDEFYGAYWVPDGAEGQLFVQFHVTARDQLSLADRDAFIEALRPFEGKTAPYPTY
jgi:hypothetical protein